MSMNSIVSAVVSRMSFRASGETGKRLAFSGARGAGLFGRKASGKSPRCTCISQEFRTVSRSPSSLLCRGDWQLAAGEV